jgi:hypothetical protein
MTPIFLALSLSLGNATPQAPAPAVPQAAPPAASASTSHTRWGLMLDAGVPDFVGASLLYRPLPWLRAWPPTRPAWRCAPGWAWPSTSPSPPR